MKRPATILTFASSLLAATPALAGGWYLMEPCHFANTETLADGAPLSSWQQIGTYATLQDCQGARIAITHYTDNDWRAVRLPDSSGHLLPIRLYREAADYSICITSDDPRLGR
jgi:hypothetical protein